MLAIAGRQKQVARSDQLWDLGFSRQAVSRRVVARRLFVIHPGVFALHPPPYTRDQLRLAAVFAGGPDSLVSHWGSASLQGLADHSPPLIAITNRTGRGSRCPTLTVHRSQVDPRDRRMVRGIPCTSAARTIIDIAPTASLTALEALLLAADSLHLLNRGRLEALLDERHGRPGTRKLRSLITDEPVEARNANERRLFSICREFGLPLPLVNHRIHIGDRTFYADFCWPDLHLIIEADSWRWHGGRTAHEGDADRVQLLSLAGWRIVRFTRDQIRNRRAETGRRLAALARFPR